MKYAVFWGCTIKVRYPSVEKAAKLALQKLGVELREVEGTTCCPLPEVFMVAAPEVWRTVAARNLSLISKTGLELLVVCNGCYETFRRVSKELDESEELRGRIGEMLGLPASEIRGASVKHAVDLLYGEIDKLESEIARPLEGLKVAIHPGCKLYEDEEEDRPGKFTELVKLLGCEVVDYPIVRLCCGVPYNYADREASLRERAAPKIRVVKERGADAITTFCPGCMLQYELAQVTLKKELGAQPVPALNYMELLALAMGFSAKELGLAFHVVPTKKIVEKLGGE